MFFKRWQITDLTFFLLSSWTWISILYNRFKLLFLTKVRRPVFWHFLLHKCIFILVITGAWHMFTSLTHKIVSVTITYTLLRSIIILGLFWDTVMVGSWCLFTLVIGRLVSEGEESFVHGVGVFVGARPGRGLFVRRFMGAALSLAELDFGGLDSVVHGHVVGGTREVLGVGDFEPVVFALRLTRFVRHIFLRLTPRTRDVCLVGVFVLVPKLHRSVFFG